MAPKRSIALRKGLRVATAYHATFTFILQKREHFSFLSKKTNKQKIATHGGKEPNQTLRDRDKGEINLTSYQQAEKLFSV